MLNRDSNKVANNDMSTVYQTFNNNQQQIQRLFRKYDQRDSLLEKHLAKARKGIADSKLKQHNVKQSGGVQQEYLTSHLHFREVQKTLKGKITKCQMEKQHKDFLESQKRPAKETHAVPVSQAETASKSILQLIADQEAQEGFEQLQPKPEISLQVRQLLEGNVYELFTPVQFRKLMDISKPNNVQKKVALLMMTKFFDQVRQGTEPLVPKLTSSTEPVRLSDFQQILSQLRFVLQNSDREDFIQLRDGKSSLVQIIAKMVTKQTGEKFVVLDDLDGSIPNAKPNQYVRRAFADIEKEEKLFKHAEQRGVSLQLLHDTAPNITFDHKCLRSIYSRPVKKQVSPSKQHQFRTHKLQSEEVRQRNTDLYEDKQKERKVAIDTKWAAYDKRKGTQNQKTRQSWKDGQIYDTNLLFDLPAEIRQIVTAEYNKGKPEVESKVRTPIVKSQNQLRERKVSVHARDMKLERQPGLGFLVRMADDQAVGLSKAEVLLPKRYIYTSPVEGPTAVQQNAGTASKSIVEVQPAKVEVEVEESSEHDVIMKPVEVTPPQTKSKFHRKHQQTAEGKQFETERYRPKSSIQLGGGARVHHRHLAQSTASSYTKRTPNFLRNKSTSRQTKTQRTAASLRQSEDTPCITGMKVPDSVVDWYVTNIAPLVHQHEDNSFRLHSQPRAETQFGTQRNIAGLSEQRSELSFGTDPARPDESMARERAEIKQYVQNFNIVSAKNQSGINWLTGHTMNKEVRSRLAYSQLNPFQISGSVLLQKQRVSQGTSCNEKFESRRSDVSSQHAEDYEQI